MDRWTMIEMDWLTVNINFVQTSTSSYYILVQG